MKKAISAVLALLCAFGTHGPAGAQALVATLETALGDAPVPDATAASLELNPDGTIQATVNLLSTWQLIGAGLAWNWESHDSYAARFTAVPAIRDPETQTLVLLGLAAIAFARRRTSRR